MGCVASGVGEHQQAEVEAGTLLVASPTLTDPNFARSVVFVIDHRPAGTLGVVLKHQADAQRAMAELRLN